MEINEKEIRAFDLTGLSEYILDQEAREFFLMDAGVEHYKLLAWLSTQFSGVNIADIGTYKGASALALSYNTTSLVNSYDISPMHAVRKGLPNVNFTVTNAEFPEKWLDCSLIMLDTVHDGIHERKVIEWLISQNWKGVLVLDDIHHFPEQKKLWEEIDLPKQDVTHVGHWSGTGIIRF